ncbi:hypothetical protein Tco_0141057 [Tanacetum coccineum]
MRTQPAISLGNSDRVAEAMTLSDSTFRKRYRSSYETLSQSPTLLVWKRYRGTSELILDIASEGDKLGDEDIKEDGEDESSDIGDKGERSKDEVLSLERGGGGYTRGSAASSPDCGYSREWAFRSWIRGIEMTWIGFKRGLSSQYPTLATWVDLEDGRVYTKILTYAPPVVLVQTPPSPKWSSDEDQFLEVGAQLELHESILYDYTQCLDVLLPTLFADIDRDVRELSLEREQERTTMTFGAMWRPVLALEAWAGHVDTRMADMSRAGYDGHRLIHDILVQHAAMQRELQEMRGRVTALEQERGRREL